MSVKVTSHIAEVKQALLSKGGVALEACGLIAENAAKNKIESYPAVDTGRLLNSISHTVIENKEMQVGTNVEYAV